MIPPTETAGGPRPAIPDTLAPPAGEGGATTDAPPMPPKYPPRTPEALRRAVEAEMARRGWSAWELASQSGVAHPIIYRWFNDDRGISVESLLKILRVLDLGIYPDGGER